MKILPVGDRDIHRQTGYHQDRPKPAGDSGGYHVRGSATRKILDAVERGEDVGWAGSDGAVERGDRWGSEHL